MATIEDVARLANVNKSTVSRVINNKPNVHPDTRKRVLNAIKMLDYQPSLLAKGLRDNRTFTIAFFVPTIRTSLFSDILKGAESVARRKGYMVLICNTEDQEELENEYIFRLKSRHVDGFLYATFSGQTNAIRLLQKQDYPLVLVVRGCEDLAIDSVVFDYFTAAYDAVMLLKQKGCKNIALITGPLERPPYLERYKGYIKAIQDCGFTVDMQNICIVKHNRFEDGFEAMNKLLLNANKVDGVVSSVDPMSIGAMRAIRKRGLNVPKDIKLIDCTGNTITGMLETPLTSMVMPGEEMGAIAAERLITLIEQPNITHIPKTILLPAKLAEREST